jgi:hypothetical protein
MYLEVQVGSEAVSCITYKTDLLPLIYLVSDIYKQFTAVSVPCFLSVSV